MAHGILVPEFWEDDRTASLSDVAFRVASALCGARWALQPPGLVCLDAGEIGDRVWKKVPEFKGRKPLRQELGVRAIRELVAVQFVEYDEDHGVVHVRRVTRHNTPHNANALGGWWKRWVRDVPPSPLKFRWVQTLRLALEERLAQGRGHGLWDVWGETFGTLSVVTDTNPGSHQGSHWPSDGSSVSAECIVHSSSGVFSGMGMGKDEALEGQIPLFDAGGRRAKYPADTHAALLTGEVTVRRPTREVPVGEKFQAIDVEEMLSALEETSGGRFVAGPPQARHHGVMIAVRLEAKAVAKAGWGIDDVRLAGRLLAAKDLERPYTLRWVPGRLREEIAAAISWNARGRPQQGFARSRLVGREQPYDHFAKARELEALDEEGRQRR